MCKKMSCLKLYLMTAFLIEVNTLLTVNVSSTIFNFLEPTAQRYTSNHKRETNEVVDEEYDFIVVGSGSSGSVIASRLSENPDWKILLLEAGNRANIFTEVPLVAPVFQVTPYNWGYTMEKQEGFCNAMEDKLCAWPRGRALGGSTVINYVIYTRGNPLDFNRWEAQGNPGWSYKEVLQYYLKSENCNLGPICDSQFHGVGGELSVEYPYASSLIDVFLKAGQELGERLVDYNSDIYMGFSRIQANLKRGRRHSASAAFLDPISDRKNLRILTAARVTKVLIDPEGKTTYGVEFQKRKVKYRVRAKKEVILSAGTFHSPQLLMLSGIGPADHLGELGIPLVQDLPVGETMYDHISFLGALFTVNQTTISLEQTLNPLETLNWLVNGKGVLTSLGGVEALAYIKTDESREVAEVPDIELILASIGSMQYDYGLISRRELRVTEDFYNKYFKDLEGKNCYSILPMLLHPKSKGYLKLRSDNPLDKPLLYGNYLSDSEGHDLKTLISSIRYIQRLSETKPFQAIDAKLYDKPIPGCEDYIFGSKDYWECAVRSLSITLHHQISTCKMGPKDDPESVVDSRMRVHGVKNLRVADTSVIPVTLSAHTSAPGMMIGERASDMIKEDWGVII